MDVQTDAPIFHAGIPFVGFSPTSSATWGQNLHYHPHVHCVAPGGGLSLDGSRWVPSRPKFFLPVRVLSRLYRRLFLEYLDEAHRDGFLTFHGSIAQLEDKEAFDQHLAGARKVEWVVYSKPPFGGPEQVLAYVGRYTHRRRRGATPYRALVRQVEMVSWLWWMT
ncbi:transposase, partial [bacterium]|nr:transposase [bacterium]